MWREMIIFADKQTHNQVINSKTEAHSNPLWIVGERANYHKFLSSRKYVVTAFTTEQTIYLFYTRIRASWWEPLMDYVPSLPGAFYDNLIQCTVVYSNMLQRTVWG